MEEEKHRCKICRKSFVNGRALGGHMRSHMLTHPLPSQLDLTQPESDSSSMADVVQDRESETESSKNKPTRKRSRLNRRSIYVSLRHHQDEEKKTSQERIMSESCTEQEPMSSVVSDGAAAEDEDVALSLMMLSRDTWENKEEGSDDHQYDEDEGLEEKKRKWFKCETCDKVFKTYQALGGHRASHKKKRGLDQNSCVSDEMKKKSSDNGHECPICLKVFASGQALGGHKRSHANVNIGSPAKKGIVSLIDLNLPAPSEDEDLVSSVFNA